ncbi:MAG: DUF1574 domain-containing protein [Bacteroidales bacterium]|nr:DUF1574 domain-containing protein [Bacteroidales bacterium]
MPAPMLIRLRIARLVHPATLIPSRRPTARAAVMWGMSLFFAVQLGVGLTSELYPRIRDPLYGDKFVKLERRRDMAGPQAATVLMIGSSRTGLAFNGKRAETILSQELQRPITAFNFGIPASGPVTHLVYWNRLLKSGVKPDLLLLEILPSMLADGHGGPLERHWFFADRVTTSEVDTLIQHGFDPTTVRERHIRSVLLPAYTLRFQLLTRVIPSWLPWQVRFDWSRGADECGWGTTQTQFVDPTLRAIGTQRAHNEYAPILANFRPGGPAVGALRELLGTCREQGIPVRLVLMPEGTEFRSWYPPERLATLKTFLGSIATEYGVSWIDAQNWLPDEAFYDSHHMLAVGADAFTDRLIRDFVVPLLQDVAGYPKH